MLSLTCHARRTRRDGPFTGYVHVQTDGPAAYRVPTTILRTSRIDALADAATLRNDLLEQNNLPRVVVFPCRSMAWSTSSRPALRAKRNLTRCSRNLYTKEPLMIDLTDTTICLAGTGRPGLFNFYPAWRPPRPTWPALMRASWRPRAAIR